jgi:hypothetical protein
VANSAATTPSTDTEAEDLSLTQRIAVQDDEAFEILYQRYAPRFWGTYERHVDTENHTVGKEHMQRIERKYITWRTWMKRYEFGLSL